MLPESTNGTGGTSGGGIAVPMAWLCAEYLADEMVRAAGLAPPGTLEHRAGRLTLALTVHLSEGAGPLSPGRVDEWLRRTAYDSSWASWVEERLAARAATDGGSPDLTLARAAWRRLRDTWVHAADLDGRTAAGPCGEVDESTRVWLPAWELGLPLAHLSLQLR
ncbi:hypothetical protein [Streptomyces sp. NPDC003327]